MDFIRLFSEGGLVLEPEEEKLIVEAGKLPSNVEFHQNPGHELQAKLNQTRIISEMYSVKHAEKNTNAQIDSNKELAKSNNKHARAMRWLTGALIVVGAVHAILAMLPTPLSKIVW